MTPLEETTQLYQSIRENRPSATPMATQRESASAEVSDALNRQSVGIPAVRQPHSNLADMLHASGRSDDAMAHPTQVVTIFAEIGVDSGDLHPDIWKLVEW